MRREISFDLDKDVFDRLLVLSEQAGLSMREYIRRRLYAIVRGDKGLNGIKRGGKTYEHS